ncbi:MAG: methylated-DNA--[protein]-cysteine S-methyltransferase, partial [Pseudomonadota bacterium]
FRSGGAAEELIFAIAPCSLGFVLVASSTKGICAVILGDSLEDLPTELRKLFPHARLRDAEPSFSKTVAAITAIVEQPETRIALPLDIRGTAFQRRVWEALQEIPPGETASYSEIAERISAPKAVRAVAGACAANKIAVAIPCHRAVRKDGSMSGYRWGKERKRALLNKEQK